MSVAHAQTQPFVCQTNSGVPPIVRASGLTELVGEMVIDCTGGTPTPGGQVVAAVDIVVTLALPAKISSRPTGGLFSETLLLVDEPNSALFPSKPLLNCGHDGAADSGPDGPGICSIRSSGNPALTYNGFTCDAGNVFGCSRPNVFQGRFSAITGENIQLRFPKVPLDPPGDSNHRYLRITNLRVNVAAIPVSPSYALSNVIVNVRMEGANVPQINNPAQILAYMLNGMTTPRPEVAPGTSEQTVTSPIRRVEGFSSSWRARNISADIGDNVGTPGNGTFDIFYYTYNGGTGYPADVAQNVPGAVYNVESGFQWQNNTTNRPPSPNPPLGVGTVPVLSRGGPLGSASLGGLNTGIDQSGVANSGTRIAIRFTNIPAGATVELPPVIQLTSIVFPQTTPSTSGVMQLTSTDSAGAGAFTPRSGFFTSSDSLAVYEVLFSDPFTLETMEVPFTLRNAPPGTALNAIVTLA
ncbi:MAG: hypothetical protein ABI995_10920, partial [Acidobacteriota bacterium]